MAAKVGEEQVHVWRRSFDVAPPALQSDDPRHPDNDRKYAALSAAERPATESLKDTIARVLPYWHEAVVPELKAGRRVLIAAHGNSLRGLVKYLDGISDAEIPGVEIPHRHAAGLPPRRRSQADRQVLPLRTQPRRSGGGQVVARNGKGIEAELFYLGLRPRLLYIRFLFPLAGTRAAVGDRTETRTAPCFW